MKQKLLITLSLFLINIVSYSQNSEQVYFGQKAPKDIPEIFASGIISTEAYEFGGSFTPDGKDFYFTRRPTYQGSANRIFHTNFSNNKWENPKIADFAKDIFEFEPNVTPDGERIYYFSERTNRESSIYDGDLWYIKRNGEDPNEAVFFDCLINKKYVMSVSSSMNGTLYFAGFFNGERGIFRSQISNNKYESIEYLPEEVNYLDGAHPFISPDESYIIFDAQVSGRGNPELFISFKKKDGGWTKAVNMGATINSTKTEFAAFVSPDGNYLFFSRRVNGNGDIYWVDAQIIHQLKHR